MTAGRRGFTLIEVLVGMTVAGIAIAAGFGALALVSDRAAHAEEAIVPSIAGATTRQLLTEWLAGARAELERPGPDVPFQGADAATQGLYADEIIFPTTARTPLSSSTAAIRLYIDVSDTTAERGLVAEMSERASELPTRIELVPEAGGLHISYLPDVELQTEWLPEWIDMEGLPLAVEIVLVAAPGEVLPPLLQYPLRVALEAAR